MDRANCGGTDGDRIQRAKALLESGGGRAQCPASLQALTARKIEFYVPAVSLFKSTVDGVECVTGAPQKAGELSRACDCQSLWQGVNILA
jgi:hypothetical protein